MSLDLLAALDLTSPVQAAFCGAGGKTTALFQTARRLAPPVIVSTTTHLGAHQAALADRVVAAGGLEDLGQLFPEAGDGQDPAEAAVTLLAGVGQVSGPDQIVRIPGPGALLDRAAEIARVRGISVLVEADGSRLLPLKAPAAHEPPVPTWADAVVVVAGLSGLGRPLGPEWVHRPEQFGLLSGLEVGQAVDAPALARVLAHPLGGLKNIPAYARRIALLNQADSPDLQAQAGGLAALLQEAYERVIVASLGAAPGSGSTGVHAVYTRVAGIVLAGGEAQRYGRPKQLLPWRGKPFVWQSADLALRSGLDPVVVITGAHGEAVRAAVAGLPVIIQENPDWAAGQSTSMKAGLRALPAGIGAAVFLLADQPHLPPALIRQLVETHRRKLPALIVPDVDGRRGNPVLFDRRTFRDLLEISGDVGGRAIFGRFAAERLPWLDERILLDVDTPADYARLLELE